MSCEARAVLMITRVVADTSTHVARARTELRCGLPVGHAGPHRDLEQQEPWEGSTGKITTILRQEEEEEEEAGAEPPPAEPSPT